MSVLINGLLTGGILIGRICQALGAVKNSKVYADQRSGFTVQGDVSSGGVKFFRSNTTGKSTVYAFNPDMYSPVTVVIPNELDKSGLIYIIQPMDKLAIGEVDDPKVSPMLNIITGPTNGSSLTSLTEMAINPKSSLLKLTFTGLRLFTGHIRVGSFTLSCTTTQLTIISTQITATALAYMWFSSDKGIVASSQNRILPTSQSTMLNTAGSIEQYFNIDFASLGFNSYDEIDGQITLEVASSGDEFAKLSNVPSEPLHPTELEFFARLSRGEL